MLATDLGLTLPARVFIVGHVRITDSHRRFQRPAGCKYPVVTVTHPGPDQPPLVSIILYRLERPDSPHIIRSVVSVNTQKMSRERLTFPPAKLHKFRLAGIFSVVRPPVLNSIPKLTDAMASISKLFFNATFWALANIQNGITTINNMNLLLRIILNFLKTKVDY